MATNPATNAPATPAVATPAPVVPAKAPKAPAPAAATLPAGRPPVPCTGKVTTVAMAAGGTLTLAVPHAAGMLHMASAVPTAPGYPAGAAVTCKVGKVAKFWLGVNGTPLVATLVAVPGGTVAYTYLGNGTWAVNAYPTGHQGATITLVGNS